MKAIWTGSISFGLISIGIELYSAIKEHVIGFTLLCAKCHTAIRYERWCRECHKQVAWTDVVKGLKLPDGSYFIITQEKLKELKAVKTDSIDILEFVDMSEIKPLYLENHYYVGPSKKNQKAFFLFARVLQESRKVAIGRLVLREKEYVCAIMPYENVLLLSTLHYAYEIRPLESLSAIKKEIGTFDKQELALANQLVSQFTHKTFDLSAYRDMFSQKLVAEIKKSKSRKKLPEKTITQKVKKSKENDLVSSLKASLQKPSKTVATKRKTKKAE